MIGYLSTYFRGSYLENAERIGDKLDDSDFKYDRSTGESIFWLDDNIRAIAHFDKL